MYNIGKQRNNRNMHKIVQFKINHSVKNKKDCEIKKFFNR